MRGFLLDTNVISELRRPRPDAGVVAFVSGQPEDALFISDVTFAEIRFGIERLDDAERRHTIGIWLDQNLRPLFAGRTLAISEDILLRWRLQLEGGKRRGHVFGQLDLFIAAVAAEHDLIVVSRDVTYFVAAHVAVFDPWQKMFIAPGGSAHAIERIADADLLGRLSSLHGARS